ncbi:MAG: cytochrome C [Gammaproteobacteria bacterium]|nr:MAG: cytochrome C [Gammaproteobacteria bacterium]
MMEFLSSDTRHKYLFMRQSPSFLLFLFLILSRTVGAAEGPSHHHQGMMEMDVADERISLGLPEPMRRHQLANMRSHLEAVREIIADLAAGRFDHAAEVAHARLGLTPEMQRMCNMFRNEEFRAHGLAFHHQADAMAEIFRKGKLDDALNALGETLDHCVQCHQRFRQ